MTLEELLKDDETTLNAVKKAIKTHNDNETDSAKKVKFIDLGEGQYVAKSKYSDLETKYNELKDAPNQLEAKVKELEESYKDDMQAEKDKFIGVVKKMAVDSAVSSLGITDKLTEAGIRSLIKMEDIKVGEDYSVTDGLDSQLKTIKETYKDSFVKPTVVSTGQSIPESGKTSTNRKYTSRAEIEALSYAEVQADLDNITAQLADLK